MSHPVVSSRKHVFRFAASPLLITIRHTKYGGASEDLAVRMKDVMGGRGVRGYFDLDDLQTLTLQKLTEAIIDSCCVILFLNDQCLDSRWVVHEVRTAKRFDVPILCMVDTSNWSIEVCVKKCLNPPRHWMMHREIQGEPGYHWLFNNPIVSEVVHYTFPLFILVLCILTD